MTDQELQTLRNMGNEAEAAAVNKSTTTKGSK